MSPLYKMEPRNLLVLQSNCDNLLGHISSKDNPAKWHIKSTSREQCAASHYAVNPRTVLAAYSGVFTPPHPANWARFTQAQ